MNCPNCTLPLTSMARDDQEILHCKNCGGSFFEENGINRITIQTAQELHDDQQSDELSGKEKLCPKDATKLNVMSLNEAVPQHVILLQCAKCKGIFTYAEDLVSFKKAQQAKINYFAAWNIPLPALRSVAVLSFVAFFAAILFTNYLYVKPNVPTQAEEVVKRVYITNSGIYLFMSFETTKPVSASVLFRDTSTGKEVIKNINTEPQTSHQLTVSGIPFTSTITYQIIMKDTVGKEVKTEFKKLK